MKQSTMLSVLAVFAVATSSLYAGKGGSGYSRIGLGDIRYIPSTRSQGMGGITLALLSPTDISHINPASWTRLANTRIVGSFLYEGISTSDGLNSAYFGSGDFSGFLLAMPLSKSSGISFAIGFNPYSSVGYKVRTTGNQGGHDYQLMYGGTGGLSTGWLGLSATPFEDFHVGAMFNYIFGNISNAWDMTFTDSAFYSNENTRTTSFSGGNFTFGLIYTGLGKLTGSNALNNLNIGFTLSTSCRPSARRDMVYRYISGYDTTEAEEGTLTIPIAYGVGLSYLIKEKYLLGLDYYAQDWSSFESYGVKSPDIRNSYRISFGGEMLPEKEPSLPLLRRIAYRLGAYYNSSYYQVRNEPVNELFVTAGFGLPLFLDTRIDVALEYGVRGKTENLLQKDNIVRLSVSINAGEFWFVKRED